VTTTETFLIAMAIIFTVPYLIWRGLRTDYYAPLVVVQTVAGILLGPGVLGAIYPVYYDFVFTPAVVQALNGLALWAVTLFVWIAGIELDIGAVWRQRRETLVAAGAALGSPLVLGCFAALFLIGPAWIGTAAQPWQFVIAMGMSCAVTALPVLILLMDKLAVLRTPLGQRILRYASLDDIAIWTVLALILLDWSRIGRQLAFLAGFALAAWLVRRLMVRLPATDRWFAGIIWLVACALGADWCGLHFMVGAFLAGAVLEASWFGESALDSMRHNLLVIGMPVYFLSTGLRTDFAVGGLTVLLVAALLLAVSTAGKLAGTHLAGHVLGWQRGEASTIGWLLQTKGLIMIVFANVLLDQQLITNGTFTALLLMALASTMLTVPAVTPLLNRVAEKGRP
jgi:Kef-type K+ transport system membrane component KefB